MEQEQGLQSNLKSIPYLISTKPMISSSKNAATTHNKSNKDISPYMKSMMSMLPTSPDHNEDPYQFEKRRGSQASKSTPPVNFTVKKNLNVMLQKTRQHRKL